MHPEYLKTLILAILATVLGATVWLLSPPPQLPEDDFQDEGTLFFPELKDPDSIHGLEVRVFNESTMRTETFRVEQGADGQWVIPSHHNYPADAKEQLGQVVRSFMDLKKDRMVAKAVSQQESFGVIDPDAQDTNQVGGRGRKIIFRDDAGRIAAQYIIGNKVADLAGQYYIRVPEEKRVYAVKCEPYLSTQFGDWINPDLLQLNVADIQKIEINDYSIDEALWPKQLKMNTRDALALSRMVDKDHPAPGQLVVDGLTSQEEMNTSNLDDLTTNLAQLRILGIRSINDYMQHEMTADDLLRQQRLRSAGFYQDIKTGKWYSNEGEIVIATKDQVQYTLCFGELAGGAGEALTAGVDAAAEAEQATKAAASAAKAENRYLWVQIRYLGAMPEQGQPAPAGYQKAVDLAARFNAYFYVISDEKVAKIRRSRKDLVQAKTTAAQPPMPAPAPAPGAHSGQPTPPVPVQPPTPGAPANTNDPEVIPAKPPEGPAGGAAAPAPAPAPAPEAPVPAAPPQ